MILPKFQAASGNYPVMQTQNLDSTPQEGAAKPVARGPLQATPL